MAFYTRVFETWAQGEATAASLEAAGVAKADISLVGTKEVVESRLAEKQTSTADATASIGAAVGGGVGLVAGLGVPGAGPVVVAGYLLATLAGAAVGGLAGGLIGALIDAGTSEDDARVYSETVNRGGTLLTVRTDLGPDRVRAILDAYQPIDIQQQRRDYERAGWRGFELTERRRDFSKN